MKITNKHIGRFILFCGYIFCTYSLWAVVNTSMLGVVRVSDVIPPHIFIGSIVGLLLNIVVLAFLIVGTWILATKDDVFEFTISNPIGPMLEARKQKQTYLKELEKIQSKMVDLKITEEELDLLILKEEKVLQILKR